MAAPVRLKGSNDNFLYSNTGEPSYSDFTLDYSGTDYTTPVPSKGVSFACD